MKNLVFALVVLGACKTTSSPIRSGSGGSSPAGTVHRTSATGEGISSTGGEGGGDELFRAGLITLGAAYVGTVVGGQIVSNTMFSDFDRSIGADETISKLWVPVLGPFAAIIYNEDTVRTGCELGDTTNPFLTQNCDMVTAGTLMIAVGAAAQTTGVVLTIVGLLRNAQDKGGRGTRLSIVPHGSPDGVGVAAMGSF